MLVTCEVSHLDKSPLNEEDSSPSTNIGGFWNVSYMFVTFDVSQEIIGPNSLSMQSPFFGSSAKHKATCRLKFSSVKSFSVKVLEENDDEEEEEEEEEEDEDLVVRSSSSEYAKELASSLASSSGAVGVGRSLLLS